MNALIQFAWPRGVGLACALLCTMPLRAVEAISEPPAEEPLFAVPTQLDRIGRILAPVMINGQGPFRLIIDTGANHSTISPRLVEKLGLVQSEDVTKRVLGVTGSANMPTVFIDRLQAGTLVVEG